VVTSGGSMTSGAGEVVVVVFGGLVVVTSGGSMTSGAGEVVIGAASAASMSLSNVLGLTFG